MSNDKHECGPCSLCNRTSARYFHTESWDSDKLTHFINHVCPPKLTTNDRICICRACHHDIDSNISNENYVPRWKKLKVSKLVEFSPCHVQDCISPGNVTTTAISLNNIPEGIIVIGQPSKFCPFHYHYIYNYQHQTVCKTCGIRAKIGETFRCCPNPSVTEKYLRATTGSNSIITEEDKICPNCYVKYTEVIHIHKALIAINHEVNPSEGPVSLDDDLDIVIIDLKQKAQSLKQGSEPSSLTAATIMVAEKIRHQKAIMLPAVAAYFKSVVTDEDSTTTRTTRWLLRQLEKALGHHLKSACKHRKYGTILYRAGGDLLHALSSALGSKCAGTDGKCTTLPSTTSNKIPLEEAIDIVGEEMNKKIHQQVGNLLSQEQYDYRTIHFDNLIESIDPQIWRLITTMTRSKRTTQALHDQTLYAHTKKVRQFYCLCTLLFCTNNRCCMPVHLLLTDVIKAGGGSSECVKILNRFGAVASEDTHSRLVTFVSSMRANEIYLELTPQAFRLASLDNIDVLMSHASAYAGKPSNIWHGTSIQCVEPKPKSLFSKMECEKQSNSSTKSQPQQSKVPASRALFFQPGKSHPASQVSLSQQGMLPSSLTASVSQQGGSLSPLPASQVSLSQRGMLPSSPTTSVSQQGGSLSPLQASQASVSQQDKSSSPLAASLNTQASCSGLTNREAEPTVVASTPSHSESPQRSVHNKRHLTKSSSSPSKRQRTLHEITPKPSPTKFTIKSVSSDWEPPSITKFTIEDFKTNEREQKAMNRLFQNALSYMLYKISVQETTPEKTGKCFQSFLEVSSKPTTEQECSNVIYFDILDEYADNKDTILNTLALLQEKLEIGTSVKYLGVVGDGKTYDHLHSLKVEYGKELNWLIPLPGDWHILKNYQEVIMKVYFSGGLREAAKQAGYSNGMLNSIGACGKFNKTHEFILKAWESLLRIFLSDFVAKNANGKIIAEHITTTLTTHSKNEDPNISSILKLMVQDEGKLSSEFCKYLSDLSAQDDTCKLWGKFVLEDCLPYIGLYFAMRSGNWNLRMYSVKEMAPLFSAYNRITYRKLIPQHIAELLRAPPELLSCLQNGGFVVSLSGNCNTISKYKFLIITAVYNRWTRLVDWTTGLLDYWTDQFSFKTHWDAFNGFTILTHGKRVVDLRVSRMSPVGSTHVMFTFHVSCTVYTATKIKGLV